MEARGWAMSGKLTAAFTEGMTSTEYPTSQERPAPLTVLVTAAQGRTGRQVARALGAEGHTVRAGSRSGPVRFDWADPGTWDAALAGVDAAYLAYLPDIGAPQAADALGELSRRAAAAGVRHLALLSARGQDAARAAEDAVRGGGTGWTVLRAAWFAQNFSEGPLVPGILAGGLVFPAGEVAEPFLDARDLGAVVARVLGSGGAYLGRTLELTGPRAVSFRAAMAEVSRAAGRPLGYTPVTPAAYRSVLVSFGVPEGEAAFLTAVFAQLLDGRNTPVTDGVREVLGREPVAFGRFAAQTAADGVWEAVPAGTA